MPTTQVIIVKESLPILERISEDDVRHWLAAKLHTLRKSIPVRSLKVEISSFDCEPEGVYDGSVDVHGGGECAVFEKDLSTALAELQRRLLKDPAREAIEKRAEAARLMSEAAALDQVAKGLTKAA